MMSMALSILISDPDVMRARNGESFELIGVDCPDIVRRATLITCLIMGPDDQITVSKSIR
jgi:hypothetical protein